MNKLLINEHTTEIRLDKPLDRNPEEAHLLAQLNQLVPCINSDRTKRAHKVSSRYLPQILNVYRGIPYGDYSTLPPRIQAIYKKALIVDNTTNMIVRSDYSMEDNFLMPHQRVAVHLAAFHDRFAFFYDTRTGKTPMSLQIIWDDVQINKNHKWLVICPLTLMNNAWVEDAKKFFPSLSVVTLWGKTKEKRIQQFSKNANLYIINSESFINWLPYLQKLGIWGVFLDESSTLKSPKSKFSKEVLKYSWTVKRWYLLSGTPAPNNESEYYIQIKTIDYNIFPNSITKFEQKYFDNLSYNPQFKKLVLKPNMTNTFMDLIKKYALYVDKEDVLNLPNRDFLDYTIPMDDSIKDYYKEMKNKLYLEYKDTTDNTGLITAPSEAAKINKLRQIASGFVYDEEHNIVSFSDYKIKALEELLQNEVCCGQQVLIFAYYRKEIEEIQKLLGPKCAVIYGGVSADKKDESIQRFINRQVQYLVANPASLCYGVTLTNAHVCIYYSMDYSYERYYQSRDRIYADKFKQPNDCTYYFMLVKGSMDAVIKSTVENKGDCSKAILNYLKKGD